MSSRRKTRRKPTRKQHDARILETARLIAEEGLPEGEIMDRVVGWVQLCQGEEISRESVRRYLRAARERMREVFGIPQVVLQSDAIREYRRLMRTRGGALRDRIRCRERIDSILGLDAPLRHHHQGGVTLVDLFAELAKHEGAASSMTEDPEGPPGPADGPVPEAG